MTPDTRMADSSVPELDAVATQAVDFEPTRGECLTFEDGMSGVVLPEVDQDRAPDGYMVRIWLVRMRPVGFRSLYKIERWH